MFLGAANRDPRRWTDPDAFDLARDPSGHVGFGMGIHQCVGQHVARLEAEALLTALAPRVEPDRARRPDPPAPQQHPARLGVHPGPPDPRDVWSRPMNRSLQDAVHEGPMTASSVAPSRSASS